MDNSESQLIALGIEYSGTRYHGWQRQQTGVDSVQLHVESALGVIADHPVTVVCAGRTDSGVHASNQVVHFSTQASREEKAWVLGANSHLPDDISIRWSRQVDDSFHARFSALSRTYIYLINNHRVRSALLDQYTSRDHRMLDEQKMQLAGQSLLGEQDFTSFRAASCQSSTSMRNLTRLDVVRRGGLLAIRISANAFLHHMVRNIAGLLMDIGAGDRLPEDAARVLAARDRSIAGKTAPAQGLYLAGVVYPKRFDLPSAKPGDHIAAFLHW